MNPGKTFFSGRADSPELWRKFIDPADWSEAVRQFPSAPWKLYLMPAGQYTPKEWNHFKRAVRWVWKKAAENRSQRREKLSVRDLLKINALVIFGDSTLWRKTLRNNRPIFNYRTTEEILRVYESGSCLYRNGDGLPLRIDGFWPAEAASLDFFTCCRALAATPFDKNPKQWEKVLRHFKTLLHQKVSGRGEKWQVYFTTRRKDLIKQLEIILDWYQAQANRLLAAQESAGFHPREVLELAVKMQRYVDMTQFCMDGSGRTSKLVQEYIFLRFGYFPPKPVYYEAYRRGWENGTYLPLKKAIQMQRRGWTAVRLNSPGKRPAKGRSD